ncbi:PqqD family protein [Candidatus Sumerlaeota bacterium]|nr:PqqD family protein [Candidatus Sumerlaeota bacterium]
MSPASATPRKLDRPAVMKARPEQMPFVHRATEDDGGLKIAVKLRANRLARFLGGGGEVERTFQLDALGREVYEACDGEATVEKIVRAFAKRHKLSIGEAEVSVTTYLKTLVSKALIGMAVDKPGSRQRS